MNEAARRKVIEQYVEAYNRFDVDGMLALLTPDVRFENVSGEKVTASSSGLGGFRQLAEQGAALFSERAQTITALQFGPASVVASIAWRGVFAVDVPDGPTAGTTIELAGESEFAFVGDRISCIIDRA